MPTIDLEPDQIVNTLLSPGASDGVCVLDSCGVGRNGSNLLIAGIRPVRTLRYPAQDALGSLRQFEQTISESGLAAIFTLSYDLGLGLNGVSGRIASTEPGIFVALFEDLLIYDYDTGRTHLTGKNRDNLFDGHGLSKTRLSRDSKPSSRLDSNFSREEYLRAVESVKELIREGETYQTNLTQQLKIAMPDNNASKLAFLSLRRDHPTPFAAYIDRGNSVVVSASPEQFLRIVSDGQGRRIVAEPIKGTRKRGLDAQEDELLKSELTTSEKDRAENTMIVDLMRNDLGRICKYGSVTVDDLCRIEEYPTLFHLVSSVSGTLNQDVGIADIIQATFPCGSITGAPRIRTMEIIERLESVPRGLSMGAIGCRIPAASSGRGEIFEMSVAIRTMVVENGEAVFNVGGGIVIDSDPEQEYAESMLKAKALLRALRSSF